MHTYIEILVEEPHVCWCMFGDMLEYRVSSGQTVSEGSRFLLGPLGPYIDRALRYAVELSECGAIFTADNLLKGTMVISGASMKVHKYR